MTTMRKSLAALLGLLVVAGSVNAATIATFADPAGDGTTPMFEFDGSFLRGGWPFMGGPNTGLDLQTPGLPGGPYVDATFTMTDVPVMGFNMLGGGTISFFDAAANPLFDITFQSAVLLPTIAFGASDFQANDVTISGPAVPFPLFDEAFAFSFANPVITAEGWTVTSAFTSSAVPEPATLVLLAIGGLAVLRRR